LSQRLTIAYLQWKGPWRNSGDLLIVSTSLRKKGIIYVVGAWNKGEIIGKPVMTEAFEMGKIV
jgi:hypothetical protein